MAASYHNMADAVNESVELMWQIFKSQFHHLSPELQFDLPEAQMIKYLFEKVMFDKMKIAILNLGDVLH